jgi:hypothetical protein
LYDFQSHNDGKNARAAIPQRHSFVYFAVYIPHIHAHGCALRAAARLLRLEELKDSSRFMEKTISGLKV